MLETPLTIKNIELNNRIVMPPMASAKSDAAGNITEELAAYYNERAMAGTGLIITEHAYISRAGKASPNQLSVAPGADFAGLELMGNMIRLQSDAKIIVQINHAGSAAKQDDPEAVNLAPSPVLRPGREGTLPRELTADEIHGIVEEFAEAAKRVFDAGLDGVEIHSAHGYLLNQFYSPLTNHRTDEYGGSLENRLRIHREILQAVREKTGDSEDFIISVRLGGCDYMEGGSTIEDAVQAAKILEENGADMISLSGGMCGYNHPASKEPGWFKDMSIPVKQAVSIPVLLTGGINEPEEAEKLLQEGAADLIGVGRAMLKNASWSQKAL